MSGENNGSEKSLLNIFKSLSKVENNPLAFVHELDASQITLRLYVNTVTPKWAEYVEIKSEVIREIVKRYREEGISFAFPSQSLYVQNVNEN